MAAYKGFTKAQAEAHKRYMEGVATIQVRMTAERREEIKAHAESRGESVNAFINRVIDEAMERER
jgi:predicted HicB family RNase H-like nuclease